MLQVRDCPLVVWIFAQGRRLWRNYRPRGPRDGHRGVKEKTRCLRILYLGWLGEYRVIQRWNSDVSRMPNIVNERKSRALTVFGAVEWVVHDTRLAVLRGRRIEGEIEIRVTLSRDLN